MASEGFPQYNVIDAVDLRVFDNRMQDYGLGKYIASIGFKPQVITLLENSIEQLHANDGVIDNRTLPYLWCAERAMPGGNVWSQRQLYGLVEAAHEMGIRFYMGTLCMPNKFAEYETRAQWLYENSGTLDLFITLADGSSLKEVNGAINPLRRLPDGRWYEDVLIADLLRYLNDYGMDGYFAADGWCGLGVSLAHGDYHPDMIAQFEEHSGLQVPEGPTEQRSAAIWGNPEYRAAWIRFYANRWTRFYTKLHGALKAAGKSLASLDPWARGPVDALYDYGVDYQALAGVGYDALCLQAREENWGRNGGDWLYAWEVGERASIAAIRAAAPELRLHWAICICNAPEHWIATKDAMPVLERQSLSLPTVTYIDGAGVWRRALDGLLFIFGTDASPREWDFIKRRWDFSFTFPIKRAMGPALVWSDTVHRRHVDRGERWQFTAAATYLIMAGAPIHSAVNTGDIAVSQADAYVLIDPVGISDAEVSDLLHRRADGAGLIVVGRTDNRLLQQALGIADADTAAGDALTVHGQCLVQLGLTPPEAADYRPDIDGCDTVAAGATPLLEITCGADRRLLASVRTEGGGPAVFIRRLHTWQRDKKEGRYYEDLRQYADSLPDSVDKLIADLCCLAYGNTVRADTGQLYALEREDSLHIGVENMGTCFYSKTQVAFSRELALYEDTPMKRYTPAGYLHFDAAPDRLHVTVPPDGSVELKVKLKP